MFLSLVLHELQQQVRDLRFLAGSVLILLLLVGGAVLGIRDYHGARSARELGQERYASSLWHSGRELFTYSFANFGSWEFARPVQPAQILARGSEKSADQSVRIEFEKIPEYEGDALRDPLRFLFGVPDFVFLCGTLVSLVVILLAHDSVAREREQGTLRLLLAGPISRGTVVLGKWCGGLLSLCISYGAASVVIAVLLVVDPQVRLDSTDMVRIVALLLLGAVYVAVVFSGTLLVSVVASSSAASATVLYVAWALLVLAVPSAAAPLGYLLAPDASVDRPESKAMEIMYRQHKERLDKMLAKYQLGPEHPYGALSEQERSELEIRQWQIFEESAQGILAVARTYRRELDHVDHAASWINRLSPYGCFQNACLAVANTGPGHERDLFRQNLRYQQDLLEYMMREAGRMALVSFRPTDMPAYKLTNPSLAVSLGSSLLDTMLLCLMGAVFFMVSYRVFVRRDVLA